MHGEEGRNISMEKEEVTWKREEGGRGKSM